MDPSGGAGEIAAVKRAKTPSATTTGVDHLSALPNEVLAKILLSVSSLDAVRTCVLSKRWRSVWKSVEDLHVPFFPEPGGFRAALDGADQVPLRRLKVVGCGHGHAGGLPRSVATWLPAAARRVSGSFMLLVNKPPIRSARPEEEAATIELPCFKNATSISINLWFRGRLAFPPAGVGAGVFSRLTNLWLQGVRFQDPSALGDAISSPRCPCLKKFHICHGRGLKKLAVSSTSLERMDLELLRGLRELNVDAPELKELHVEECFSSPPGARQRGPPVVAITALGLEVLDWKDWASQDVISFSHRLPHLRSLGSFLFFVYGDDNVDRYNSDSLRTILQGSRSMSIETLTLMLGFVQDIDEFEYLMETMSVLPDLTTLHLSVMSSGHCFGDSSLHVLRICTGMRKLVLELSRAPYFKEPFTCPSGCICRQRTNWQTEELVLVCLQEIEIQGFGRSDHDIVFVEQLFGWATSLTKATIFFDELVTEGVAKELCWMFQFFRMPKLLHIDFRYHNKKKVLHAAEE